MCANTFLYAYMHFASLNTVTGYNVLKFYQKKKIFLRCARRNLRDHTLILDFHEHYLLYSHVDVEDWGGIYALFM